MKTYIRFVQFKGREVIYCVSSLVSKFAENDEWTTELEDLYQGSPSYGEYTCPECDHQWEDEPETETCPGCKFNGLEDSDFEVFEYFKIMGHWIVTTWLANRLEEKGEAICKDFYGLTIWGRSCSGQSIALDGVISEIHRDLHAKV